MPRSWDGDVGASIPFQVLLLSVHSTKICSAGYFANATIGANTSVCVYDPYSAITASRDYPRRHCESATWSGPVNVFFSCEGVSSFLVSSLLLVSLFYSLSSLL